MKNVVKIFFVIVLSALVGSCKPKPQLPIDPTVKLESTTHLTATSVVVKISVNNGNQSVTERGAYFSIKTLTGSRVKSGQGLGTFSVKLPLIPNTAYVLRGYAITAGGVIYSSSVTITTPAVTDVDGNNYQSVKVGDQIWSTKNLIVTHYRDGTPIPNVADSASWGSLTTGAYCNYGNDTSLAETYGHLYNWYAAYSSHNLAPKGWHVATNNDWYKLWGFIGGDSAGGKLKERGIKHWERPNTGATNSTNFTALPGGIRYVGDEYTKRSIIKKVGHLGINQDSSPTLSPGEGGFYWIHTTGIFFTDDIYQKNAVRIIILSHDDDLFRSNYVTDKTAGLSIRILKN